MAYYVHTKVTIKFGQNQGYNKMMAELSPYMAQHGWKLAFGLQPFLGDFTELVHIWEVEKFEDIGKALQACYSDS